MIRILVILGLLCLYLPAQTADPAGVIFPETTYDFGTVKQGSIVVHSFAVKNIGTAPVTIKNVQLSIPGTNARFRPVLAPDGEGTITLGWDTSHSTGEMDGEATVLFGDGSEQRETLLLKGIVPNELPIPEPVLVDRMMAVASMKPPINRSASPTWMASGEVGVPPVCWFVEGSDVSAAAWARAVAGINPDEQTLTTKQTWQPIGDRKRPPSPGIGP